MSRTDDVYKPALESAKIPILTLDHKWHKLFTQIDPDSHIKKREEELNTLLKRQGKLTNDVKNIKRLKLKLMDEIMENAEEADKGKSSAEKKMEDNKRLINECNDKLEACQDELMDLPKQINEVNYQLMLLTMEVCYERLQADSAEIEEIAQWITQIRVELKKKLIRKQEKEIMTNELYKYMHQIFGANVIEIFDMKYIPESKLPSLSPAPAPNPEGEQEAKADGK